MTSPALTENECLELVTTLWDEVLGDRPSSPTANFFDEGGSSLSAVNLAFLLEDRTGVSVPLTVLASDGTPEGLARYLAHNQGASS